MTLIRGPFHPRGTAVAPKRPRSFCRKTGGAYTHDPTKSEWADYAAVQAYCGNISGDDLRCNLSGNIRPQSSQLAEPLWTNPGLKSDITVRELISTLKKKKNKRSRLGMISGTFSPKSSQTRNKPPPPYEGLFNSRSLTSRRRLGSARMTSMCGTVCRVPSGS